MQIFLWIFPLVSNIHDKSNYPWRFKCSSALRQLQLLAGDCSAGHITSSCMASSKVTEMFTPITFGRIELEPCARYHCVCLVMARRLICDMTYLPGSLGLPPICTFFEMFISPDGFSCQISCWFKWSQTLGWFLKILRVLVAIFLINFFLISWLFFDKSSPINNKVT